MVTVTHCSADPGEILYIMGGDNETEFKKLGITMKKEGLNGLIFSAKSQKDLAKLDEILTPIIERYHKPKRRSVVLTSDIVACARGKKSSHLEEMCKKTGIRREDVSFYNQTSENGVKMVEVVVTGMNPAVHHFMFELLRSVSFFLQRENDFKMPPRKPRKKEEEEEEEEED